MSKPGDLWRRADEAFDRALDMPASDRPRFLAELNAADPELHAEVSRLLAAHEHSAEFLDEAAPVFAASLLPDQPSWSPELPAGTRVGAYSILERIGSGGMGVVYKAHDERLDRFVALKFLAEDPRADEGARNRLLAEARIASALDHPGIAVVHEISETADHGVFVAMAFYEGATLKERLRDGPLPLETCVDLAIQIAEALGAAHRNGIVHRDIKPANVIVTRDGVAKIVDFGIARIARIARITGAPLGGTSTDPARGSPGYMSPEQRRGDDVDARADVWSFGVLLHEMLTGRRPDDGVPAAAVPAAFRRLLGRCLHPDPGGRYTDASALLADLRVAANGRPGSVLSRMRWPAVAAAVGVLGLAAVAGLAMLDRSAAREPDGTTTSQGPIPGLDVTTTSLVAYRFYQEGRRSLAAGDYHNAVRLFDAALAEDSAFAMAAYHGSIARVELGLKMSPDATRELARLAEGVSESERRVILGVLNDSAGGSPSANADARAAIEPTDYRGFYARGRERFGRGDWLSGASDLRRAVAQAPSDAAAMAPCNACDALAALQEAYYAADSLAAAERVLREWIRREPGSARAWRLLAGLEVAQQRYDEAEAANRRAVELSPGRPDDVLFPAMSRIPQADFAAADRMLADLIRDGASVVRVDAVWAKTISLRYQGRLREALEAIDRYAAVSTDTTGALLHRGQILFEMGRSAEAATLFDSSASLSRRLTPDAWAARMEAWSLTHRAAAAAALGDTSLLVSLADSIESVSRRSSFGRDPFLHHHVRGLLLGARGDLEAAVLEFRRAIYSPTIGYTRTNVELGRVLIALGRPHEAVAILAPALRGSLEASNLYATHTEIHDLLGRAWRAAGRADSARVHDEWALKAWQNADPVFERRRATVRRRMEADAPRSVP